MNTILHQYTTCSELTASSLLKTSEIKDLKSSLEELSSIKHDLEQKLTRYILILCG